MPGGRLWKSNTPARAAADQPTLVGRSWRPTPPVTATAPATATENVSRGRNSWYNGLMQDARVGRQLVLAGPDSPDVAVCPACGGQVKKRKRTAGGKTTWFYRHRTGADDCPRRYRPVT
jgi:hypothetical protein